MRLVEHVDAHFLADHVLLVLQILGGDIERSHAVGLEEQRALERVGWQRLVVVGVVEARRAVHDAAGFLHQRHVLHLLHVRGALEHHVLEQVRKAGASLRFDAEADVVHDLDQHDGCRSIGRHDNLQSVIELEVLNRNAERLRRRGDGGCQ